MDNFKEKLYELKKRLTILREKFDVEQKRIKIRELEAQTLKPDFWQDNLMAQQVMKELNLAKSDVEILDDIAEKIEDALILIDLAQEEQKEEENKDDIETQIKNIAKEINSFELRLFLSGPYDKSDAILSIHSGQGGTEAMDWVQMLERMYSRFIQNRGWKLEVMDENPGEEAGFKSVTLLASAPYAYGYLKNEAGTHRLVRQSPFNADNLRQTSFALVEVLPAVEEIAGIDIKPEEIEFEAFRSSGKGGQNVNKVSTAVRLKHIPTGIVVTCQTERYQVQNRANALKILRAKLWVIEEEKAQVEKTKLKGEHKLAGWGNQIRSYVLHPYHLVKDLRTGVESNNTDAVLDGELDEFIEAELRK